MLEFCISCSFANTKADLVDVIESKLYLLISFHDFIILLSDDGGQNFSKFIHRHVSDNPYELQTPAKSWTRNEIDELICAKRQCNSAFSASFPGFEDSTRTTTVLPLKHKEDMLGVLLFTFDENEPMGREQSELISKMAAQITATILNIRLQETFSAHQKNAEILFQQVNCLKQQQDIDELHQQDEIRGDDHCDDIIGSGVLIKRVFNLINRVSPTVSSVLIMGETGTGKELIARAIHNHSPRSHKNMVKINCAALPAELIESELFGHEKGSFTGATERRIGKFELAHNSTLFLDEIGELPLELQVKLLRALQEREIERVGGCKTIKTDVRIVAATNKDLFTEVQQGNFRSDLFFRLNIFPIIIPPLRERREDIPLLAMHFLYKYTPEITKGKLAFSSKVMKQLMAYSWPGNVRELEHIIERTIVLTQEKIIKSINLPVTDDPESGVTAGKYVKTINEIEREHILAVLKLCGGKVAGIGGAAEILKIPSTTLNSKIRRLKIKKEYKVQN